MCCPATFSLVLAFSLATTGMGVKINTQGLEDFSNGDLCLVPGCRCNPITPSQIDVTCACPAKQVLRLGLLSRVSGASQPPAKTVSLTVSDCHHVELFSRIINHMQNIENITFRNLDTLTLHKDLFEPGGFGQNSTTILNMEIHSVHKLNVKMYTFRGIRVDNKFFLNQVNMGTVQSMAFSFDHVKEFSVIHSTFQRIAMWGIKLESCAEFNVLGMSQFVSLSSQAIHARCEKFSLAYNWFGNLYDSSFEVEYGLCDIQGNTFVSLGGKPFLDLKPIPLSQLKLANEIAQPAFVFRENLFSADPVLPFGFLAMPPFGYIDLDTSYVNIENNHFSCSCDRVAWFVAFGKYGYNTHSLADMSSSKGTGSVDFLQRLYNTAGSCVECHQKDCKSTDSSFLEFADHALFDSDGVLQCANSGLTVKNFDATSAKDVVPISNKYSLPSSDTLRISERNHMDENGSNRDYSANQNNHAIVNLKNNNSVAKDNKTEEEMEPSYQDRSDGERIIGEKKRQTSGSIVPGSFYSLRASVIMCFLIRIQ